MRLIIKNDIIIDGTGALPWEGDIVVHDGKIVEVGKGVGRTSPERNK